MAEYHDAPYTLDTQREIPEKDEAPPAAGHDEEMAETVKEFDDAFTEAQEGIVALDPEPPYQPGEGPGQEDLGQSSDDADEDSDEPPDGTKDDVLDWVGDDPDRAQQALDAERDGQNRSTLIAELEKRAD